MKIAYDAKRYFHNNTGLGNYSRTLVGGMKTLFPDNEYILYDEKTLRRTFSMGYMAEKAGCQILHGLSNELPLLLPKGRMKSIVTVHDVAWLTFPAMYHWPDRKLYDLKYGSSCRHADHVIAISESTKRDIIRFYNVPEERITVIYQPVQEFYYHPIDSSKAEEMIWERFEKSLPKDFILYVGSINSRKNLLAVLRAMAMMPSDIRPFLLVVGNGREYRREVERYIEEERLGAYVSIVTDIHNNSLLQALYAMAKVFVYPSFYEGFGLPVVEAALQKTPVITTTVSSLPEAAGPDACLIDPHAPEAIETLAAHLEHFLSDEEYRNATGISMERYARQSFSPTTLTKQIEETYRKVIG